MDMSKLRKEDVPYVRKVVEYLKKHNLKADFAGSVLNGDKQYHDVDLVAIGSLEDVTDATSGLMGISARTEPFPQKTEDGLEFKVKHLGGPTTYVNNQVDERFRIYAGGNTKIDVSLKVIGPRVGY